MSIPRFTIIYDGQCELCQWSRRTLERLTWHGKLHFIDLHDATAMQKFAQISHQEAMTQMIAVANDGQMARGYDGLVLILKAWRFTGVLRWMMRRRIVRWVGRKMYAMVARNRYRIRWLPACGLSCALNESRASAKCNL